MNTKTKLVLRIIEVTAFGLLILISAVGFQIVRKSNAITTEGYPGYPPPPTTGESQLAQSLATLQAQAQTLPTALPDRGVRVSAPSEMALAGLDLSVTTLSHPHLDGDLLTAMVRVPEGLDAVMIDLRTGQTRYFNRPVKQGWGWLQASGNYLTWTDPSPEVMYSDEFHVFDLSRNADVIFREGIIRKLDLKNNIVLWEEMRDGELGIYGYDLNAAKDLTVAAGKGIKTSPRVCSKEWVIYLENPQQRYLGSADLRAHNLVTGEDFSIGIIPFPQDSRAGNQHACDGNRVAWVRMRMEEYTSVDEISGEPITLTMPISEYHVYDLASRADQLLPLPEHGFAKIFISQNIVVSTLGYIGYDLAQQQLFSVFAGEWAGLNTRGGNMVISGDKIIWLAGGSAVRTTQRLYTGLIIRDPK